MQHQGLSSSAGAHDLDDIEEPVLVEAQEFSEDDENFAQVEDDDHCDFDYDDDEEDQEDQEQDEDTFEDDDDEMSLVRIGLHDLNTLRHLYRFGLLQTQNSRISLSIHNILISSSYLWEISSFQWAQQQNIYMVYPTSVTFIDLKLGEATSQNWESMSLSTPQTNLSWVVEE